MQKPKEPTKKINNNTVQTQTRDANFELLRIISMIMIVVLHFIGHGKVDLSVEEKTLDWFFIYGLRYICVIAVNLYVLISGYYMVKSNFKIKKVLSLVIQVLFYSAGIYLFLVFSGYKKFLYSAFKDVLFPITTKQYWFVSAYMILYFLSPFLNKFIHAMDKVEHKILLLLLTFLFCIMDPTAQIKSLFEVSSGFSVYWFIYLYLIGGYIRLYVNDEKKLFLKSKKTKFAIWIIVIAFQIFISYNETKNIRLFLKYDNVYTLIKTLLIFMIFKDLKIKNEKLNKLILAISPLTLGVYLLHDNRYVRSLLWNDLLTPFQYVGSAKLYFVMIISVIGIFIFGCMVEYLRQIIHKKLEKTKTYCKLIDFLENKLKFKKTENLTLKI